MRKKIMDLFRASEEKNLTFFIGAGVSKLSGYPDWKELTDEFVKKLNGEVKEKYTAEEHLGIAQKYYYSVENSKKEYYGLIEEKLNLEKDCNEIHDMILALNPQNIITTNFDNLIEKAIAKNGLYYEVISDDTDIKVTENKKRLLKIHGDFSKQNILLKEEDYLQYNENFKLIEMIVKYIFTTTTVIFIGYGVNDYNIKLILNWVKESQGERFKKPYFIHLDDKLDDLDCKYYESRGLNILDINEFEGIPDKNEWEEKYKFILNKIIKIKSGSKGNIDKKINSEEEIEKMYEKLLPLNRLKCLRKCDLMKKLQMEYNINDAGIIYLKNGIAKKFETNDIEKVNVMKEVFRKANILIVKDDVNTNSENLFEDFKIELEELLEINNLDFMLNFKGMERYVKEKYDDNYKNYKKAYYLFKIGKYKESYELYTQLMKNFYIEEEHLYYYLVQLNRYNVLKFLKNKNKFINGEKVENSILENIDINEVFRQMPRKFREDYDCFENLYKADELYKLNYKVNNYLKKIKENLEKENLIQFGTTELDKVLGILEDEIKFINENYIITDEYTEYRDVMKSVIEAVISIYANLECENIDIDTKNEFEGLNSCEYVELNHIEFINIIKYCSGDEIAEIFKRYKIKKIQFKEIDKCYEVIRNILEYFEKIKEKEISIILYNKMKRYIGCLVKLTAYTDLRTEIYQYIVKNIFNINENILNMSEKIRFIIYQDEININNTIKSASLLEKIIVDRWRWRYEYLKENKSLPKEHSYNGWSDDEIVRILAYRIEDFKSEELDKIVNCILNEGSMDLKRLIDPLRVCKEKTVKRITEKMLEQLEIKFDVTFFYKLFELNLIMVKEYEEKIYEYLKKYDDDILLRNIGLYCLEGVLDSEKFKYFKGKDIVFDFIIEAEIYNYEEFDIGIIYSLNNYGNKKLAENKYIKEKISLVLKKFFKAKKIKELQRERLLKIYLEYYI